MHVKVKAAIDRDGSEIARDVVVPASYSLSNLHHILQASFGLPPESDYAFTVDNINWVESQLMDQEDLDDGYFLAEATTVYEALNLWQSDVVTHRCMASTTPSLRVTILGVYETHPQNTMAFMVDGKGAYPPEPLRRKDPRIDKGADTMVMVKSQNKAADKSINMSAHAVTLASLEIYKTLATAE